MGGGRFYTVLDVGPTGGENLANDVRNWIYLDGVYVIIHATASRWDISRRLCEKLLLHCTPVSPAYGSHRLGFLTPPARNTFRCRRSGDAIRVADMSQTDRAPDRPKNEKQRKIHEVNIR